MAPYTAVSPREAIESAINHGLNRLTSLCDELENLGLNCDIEFRQTWPLWAAQESDSIVSLLNNCYAELATLGPEGSIL